MIITKRRTVLQPGVVFFYKTPDRQFSIRKQALSPGTVQINRMWKPFYRFFPGQTFQSVSYTHLADLLVHVVDISHPTFEEQIEVVNKTLAEIDKTEKPMIMVFNKIDAFTFVPKDEDDLTPRKRENIDLDELKRTWMNKLQDNCIFISAKERTNIDALKALLYERVKQIHITRFPYNDFLFQQYDEE